MSGDRQTTENRQQYVAANTGALMQRGIRFALLGGLAAGAVLACEQSITTPGACPDFCPVGEIQLIDTVFVGTVLVGLDSVLEEESFTGYVEPMAAAAMQVVGGGAAVESHGLIWFAPFADSAAIDTVFEVVRRRLDDKGGAVPSAALGYFEVLEKYGCDNWLRNLQFAGSAATLAAASTGWVG